MAETPPNVTAAEALARLRAGNDRFVRNVRSVDALASQNRRDALVGDQRPYAIILGCADSRVPAEIVFDAGLGDLFVVRVAGNVVAPSLVGSIEFAAAKFGTRLVVVLGHTRCGAVGATLDVLEHNVEAPTDNIDDIVDRISPSVAELVKPGVPREELLRTAIRANVRASSSHLRHASRMLEREIAERGLRVVGAEYALETGVVDFFDHADLGAAAGGR